MLKFCSNHSCCRHRAGQTFCAWEHFEWCHPEPWNEYLCWAWCMVLSMIFQHVTVLFYRQIPCLVDIFFTPWNFHPKLAWTKRFGKSTPSFTSQNIVIQSSPSLPGNMLWNFHPQLAWDVTLCKFEPIGEIGCCESRISEQKQWWIKLSTILLLGLTD